MGRSALAFALTALALFASAQPPSARAAADSAIESIATLDSLTGDSTVVDGRVVYVDFWASWCVPCRKSFPWMARLESRWRDQGFQVITINLDRESDAADAFLERVGVSLPVVHDPEGKLARLYDLQVMPTSFVYGRDGRLRSRHEGFDPEKTGEVETLLRRLIEEDPTP